MKDTIASLAVFRELYDNKKDIYDILCQFIIALIRDTNIDGFTSVEITGKLCEYFKFKIPESVVKTSLKRLPCVSKTFGTYSVDRTLIESSDTLDRLFNEKTQAYQKIIFRLNEFIQQNINKLLSSSDKLTIEKELHSYLLDETDTRAYTKYVAAYLLTEKDSELLSVLQTIREGLILQSGMNYTDITQLGTWKTKLTIYIDTEILFSMAGYDGDLYKLYFDDFYMYVKEINAKKRLIELKYFSATQNEIEAYFNKAKDIVAGRDILNPQKTAMKTITSGCKTPSDVIAKHSDFFTLLATNRIEHETDNIDISTQENMHYNIFDDSIIAELSTQFGYDVHSDVSLLNNISLLRKNKLNENFVNIGHILLSGNRNVLNLA